MEQSLLPSVINRRVSLVKPVSLVQSGTGKTPWSLTFEPVHVRRDDDIIWSIYKTDFNYNPTLSGIQELNQLLVTGAAPTLTKLAGGMTITNSTGSLNEVHYQAPVVLKGAACMIKLKIRSFTAGGVSIRCGLIKDSNNFVLAAQDEIGNLAQIVTKNAGSVTPLSSAKVSITAPYTMIAIIANNTIEWYVEDTNGRTYVMGKQNITPDLTNPTNLQSFYPCFGVVANNGASITVDSFEVGYFAGVGQADPHLVTYADGRPVCVDGNYFITVSSHPTQYLTGGGGIVVYPVTSDGMILDPVALIFIRTAGKILAEHSAKMVYDDMAGTWRIMVSNFSSGSGHLELGSTKKNVLKGIQVVDTAPITLPNSTQSFDGDLYHDGTMWNLVARTDGAVAALFQSADLSIWSYVSGFGGSGQGNVFVKGNGQWYQMCVSGYTDLKVRNLPTMNTELGSVTAVRWPQGASGPLNGTWGIIFPVYDGDQSKFLMVLYSPLFYHSSANAYDYGALWSYQSMEVENGSEFKSKDLITLFS